MKGTIYIDGVAVGEGEIIDVEIEPDISCEERSSNLEFLECTFEGEFGRFPDMHNRLSKFFKSVRFHGKEIVGSY